jgi:hypothetical protein
MTQRPGVGEQAHLSEDESPNQFVAAIRVRERVTAITWEWGTMKAACRWVASREWRRS